MGIYQCLPNPVSPNLNSYRKTVNSLYDLVELPNHFYRIPQSIADTFEYNIDGYL